MRFAYIDSQGNEVSIPSVDALALRIELGAISPDTELYDAQADRWGPAHTHEIFHTLSRDVGGAGGFVAPPPPVAVPAEPEPEPEPEPEVGAPADDARAFELPADEGPEEEPAAAEKPAAPAASGLDLELTFTDVPGSAPPAPVGGDEAAAGLRSADSLATDEGALAQDEDEEEDEAGAFDFGGFGAMELEGGPAADDALGAAARAAETDFPEGFGGGLELERPMSEFASDSSPAWMEPDPVAEDDGALDFRRGGAGAGEDDAPPPQVSRTAVEDEEPDRRPRSEPRSRPSPPRRKKSFPTGAVVLGVVGLAVVGGGGYFGWTTFLKGGTSNDVPEVVALPPVTIPDIPVELLPVMRDMGEAALAGMIDSLRGMQAGYDLPMEPRDDWLAGVYLANASQFPDVEAYWEEIEAYVDRVRDMDTRTFHEEYVAQLEAAGRTGDTAAILLERADSGFLATRDARFEAYALMDDLVNAALDLHQFLLLNEESIAYDPAAGGFSQDPVLEAVPDSRELGNEMWDMVDRITGALDALGTLDKVTTERLTAVLFDRIRRASFR